MKLKLILLIAGIIIIFILMLIYVLRNKNQDVSNKEPYLYFLNVDFATTEEIILIENLTFAQLKKDYPKEISNEERTDTSRVAHIKISNGSTLRFTKAIHFQNAVSGIKYAILLGTVKNKTNNETYKVIYTYGYFKTMCAQGPCNYWEYKKALWQKEEI